jgi:hypothetical protein
MKSPAPHAETTEDVERRSLQELAIQVRSWTIELFDGFPLERITWAPPHTRNHALWHAGHAVWLQDKLCVEPVTGQSELSRRWAERYGQDSQPRQPVDPAAERQLVLDNLRHQQSRLLEIIATAPELSRIAYAPQQGLGRSLIGGIIHGLHDEARHHGEMYLLLKLSRHEPN